MNPFDLIALPASELQQDAARLRDGAHPSIVSYSRKVFIPLTRLCRDVCAYCTFAQRPSRGTRAYLSQDEVLAIARAGRDAGCTEALFTLGDKPELRYAAARDALRELGASTTVEYLARVCELVLRETGLLPHANPGVLTREDLASLREVSASQGLMLESTSEHLCRRGGPHFGSPDKRPAARLETLRVAGELRVPFTTGLLIGIGETRSERIDALLAIRALHERYGHIQEVIIQNFRAKADTRMADAPHAEHEELLWTISAARLVLGAHMNIQAPPNLSAHEPGELIDAGINDWGGISPVTPDHVNPEAPWPQIERLREIAAERGKVLVERLPSYPGYVLDASRWHSASVATALVRASDSAGYARNDAWSPGLVHVEYAIPRRTGRAADEVRELIAKLHDRAVLPEPEIVRLLASRDDAFHEVCHEADRVRTESAGSTVRYVVNRNINYTNICNYRCTFCAFSKGTAARSLRGEPYDLPLDEIARRTREAWQRGATEVCMQGGIHPHYDGHTYLRILETVKRAAPAIHVHAFTPLEVSHGARTLGLSVREYLRELMAHGLGTLPGTAAEILDDEVRQRICPDKITTEEWLCVMRAAHELGLKSTATIMFGHVEEFRHVARHLLRIRALQAQTGGFTEIVPLPFVHMAAPMYVRGEARKGPTWREALLVHAAARLVLHPVLSNVQVSWVKMGEAGALAALAAGANDLGGTLMNESISRAAGTQHGQEMSPAQMERLIRAAGREPAQRTTLYAPVAQEQTVKSYSAAPLAPLLSTHAQAA